MMIFDAIRLVFVQIAVCHFFIVTISRFVLHCNKFSVHIDDKVSTTIPMFKSIYFNVISALYQ